MRSEESLIVRYFPGPVRIEESEYQQIQQDDNILDDKTNF